jgi:tetratricopeptide (TPR) repeat protein
MKAQPTLLQRWIILCAALSVLLAGCAGLGLQGEIESLMKQGQQLYAEKQYDAAIDKFVEVVTKDPQHWQAYLWLTRSFIAKGKWLDAVTNGRKAYQLAPKDKEVIPVFAEALFGGGAEALKSARYGESIALFGEYLKLEPGNGRAWLNVGKAYLGQQQFREALGAMTRGLSQGQGAERDELLRGLLDGGIQALASGKHGEAVELLKELLRHDQKNAGAYLNLAKAYLAAGDMTNAFDAFRQVLKLDPRQEEALRFLLKR